MGVKQRDDAIIAYELLVQKERDEKGWNSMSDTVRDSALVDFNNSLHAAAV